MRGKAPAVSRRERARGLTLLRRSGQAKGDAESSFFSHLYSLLDSRSPIYTFEDKFYGNDDFCKRRHLHEHSDTPLKMRCGRLA